MSKRNHHLQPNFYLKGFCSDPDERNLKVWVYEKSKPFYNGKTEQLQNPKHLTTEKAARKKDFYAFVKEDGTKDYEKYENILWIEFEEPAKPVIEKIRRFEEIDDDEKMVLSKYIASMITRGDWWREIYMNHVLPSSEMELENWSPNEFSDKEIKEAKEFVKGQNIRSKEKLHKESIIRKAEDGSSRLVKMEWRFLVPPDNLNFFTSDKPVVYFDLHKTEGQLIFPISSSLALSMTHKGYTEPEDWRSLDKNYWKVNAKTVELIRNDIAVAAIKYVYFSEKREWLVGFINNRTKKL